MDPDKNQYWALKYEEVTGLWKLAFWEFLGLGEGFPPPDRDPCWAQLTVQCLSRNYILLELRSTPHSVLVRCVLRTTHTEANAEGGREALMELPVMGYWLVHSKCHLVAFKLLL